MNYQIPKGYVQLKVGTKLERGDSMVVWNDGKASLISLHAFRGSKVRPDEMILRRGK